MRCLDHDQFSYLYDQGDHVVALIDRRSLDVDRGDKLALGEGGDEGLDGPLEIPWVGSVEETESEEREIVGA